MRQLGDKRGQIWVETVIYTLIGLAIIGLVLAAAKPKIDAMQDEIIIEQSIEALGNINDKIYEVQRATGNRRGVELTIGKGKFIIDMAGDKISWVIESSFEYSEKDVAVSLGSLEVLTKESTPWEVTLEEDYSIDIQFEGQTNGIKELTPASTPYELIIENKGIDATGNIVIDLSVA
ncbi:hypothetical protein KAI32_00175 [Candidatus Pacearchaeota archaeon]|nr:hypothetical protein [Candidatus Pacearchaeota archaeon]